MQNASQRQTMNIMKGRMNDLLKQADEITTMTNVMNRMYDSMQELSQHDSSHGGPNA